MQELEFNLCSGYLDMEKKAFVKDILLGKSLLKSIIYSSDPGFKPPEIQKGSERVRIIFDNGSNIDLGEHYEAKIKKLKTAYRDKLKGVISFDIVCFEAYKSVLDLNSDDSTIKNILC